MARRSSSSIRSSISTARRIARALQSPDKALEQYLKRAAKREAKRVLKALLKPPKFKQPRPKWQAPTPEPPELEPQELGTEDKYIDTDLGIVRVRGLPVLPGPSPYEDRPGFLAECEDAILEEIKEIINAGDFE
jgi:hypothetical protein